MELAIKETKRLIEKGLKNEKSFSNVFRNYSKVYFETNENIFGYLNNENKSRALTVLSGGDHLFSLLNKGVLDIDTFDINFLTEYVALGLKRALISKYSYNEYINNTLILQNKTTSLDVLSDILYEATFEMDIKYAKYWQEIIDYNYRLQQKLPEESRINLLSIICYKFFNHRENYLTSEEEYQKVKENLSKANITFKHSNILNQVDEFEGKYDLILLSNILDYAHLNWGLIWSKNNLDEFIGKLKNLSQEEAIIYLYYIFNLIEHKTIEQSRICLNDIENSELLNFNSVTVQDKKDGMLLIRNL